MNILFIILINICFFLYFILNGLLGKYSIMPCILIFCIGIVLYRIRYNQYLYTIPSEKIILSEIQYVSLDIPKGKTMSFTEFITYPKQFFGKQISPFIFRTAPFLFNELPLEIKRVLEHTISLHPEYTQIYLDNKDCDSFVLRFYPHLFNEYDILIPGAFKADLVRLMLLDYYGGVYNDIGHNYNKPLSTFLKKKDELVLVKDRKFFWHELEGIHNAFMCSYEKHPIIKRMLIDCISNIKNRRIPITHLNITGPQAIYESFYNYTKIVLHKKRQIYYYKNHRIRLLFLSEHELKIEDIKNQLIINTKFEGYNKIVYSSSVHYSELCRAGIIYKTN